jgi:hypothetical protein
MRQRLRATSDMDEEERELADLAYEATHLGCMSFLALASGPSRAPRWGDGLREPE